MLSTHTTHKPSFSEEERAYARALLASLQPFLEIMGTMPLQYLTAYLRVVADEGKGVTEYAEDAGISKTVMTRHLLDIGERTRDREPGFGLVFQKRDVYDLRINRTFPTPVGVATWRKMMGALKALVDIQRSRK